VVGTCDFCSVVSSESRDLSVLKSWVGDSVVSEESFIRPRESNMDRKSREKVVKNRQIYLTLGNGEGAS
jgi:hypothetical protein